MITPKLSGVYAVAEVVDDSNKRPEKTLFCLLYRDDGQQFTYGQAASLEHVAKMVEENGGRTFINDLEGVAMYLNEDECHKPIG